MMNLIFDVVAVVALIAVAEFGLKVGNEVVVVVVKRIVEMALKLVLEFEQTKMVEDEMQVVVASIVVVVDNDDDVLQKDLQALFVADILAVVVVVLHNFYIAYEVDVAKKLVKMGYNWMKDEFVGHLKMPEDDMHVVVAVVDAIVDIVEQYIQLLVPSHLQLHMYQLVHVVKIVMVLEKNFVVDIHILVDVVVVVVQDVDGDVKFEIPRVIVKKMTVLVVVVQNFEAGMEFDILKKMVVKMLVVVVLVQDVGGEEIELEFVMMVVVEHHY
jgi:hypothetical protein